MILKSCHIENFGIISNKDYDFQGTLNTFFEKNGSGKSTLATFLKVMFYGMKTSTKATFSDRQHYFPYSGGKFGGSLTFEKDGKTYRIERVFDVKSETKDSVRVYENGELLENLTDGIGEKFFGLDENSFKKTIFFGENDEEVISTSTINARLNNFVYDLGDGGYDKAITILDKQRKFYKLDKGSGGELFAIKEKIIACKREIERLSAIENSLPHKYQEIQELSKKVKALQEKYDELQKNKVGSAKLNHYKNLLQIAKENKDKAQTLLQRFNGKFLDDGDQEILTQSNKRLDELKGEKRAYEISEEKKNKLEILNSSLKDLTAQKLDDAKRYYLNFENFKHQPSNSLKISAIISFALGIILMIILSAMKISWGFIFALVGALVGGFLLFIDYKNNGKKLNDIKNEQLNKTRTFLLNYGENAEDALLGFSNLQAKLIEYDSLYNEISLIKEKFEKTQKEIEIESIKIQTILSKYGDITDLLAFITTSKTARNEYSTFVDNYNKYLLEAQNYYEQNDLKNCVEISNFDEIPLKEELENLKNSLALKEKDINNLELEIDGLSNALAQLSNLEEKLKSATFKHECIIKTLQILKDSSRKLNDKFVAPIKDRFLHYSKITEKTLGEKVEMDKNYKVYFERGGEMRSDSHLSAGQKAILNLCLRLSLIDNVFGANKPFIVIDDAFSLLDSEHLSNIKKLINELSKEFQILYFTCHESRIF